MALGGPVRQAILAVAALVAAVQLVSILLRGSPLHTYLYRKAGVRCPASLTEKQRTEWEYTAGANLALLEANDRLEMWPIAWPEKASDEALAAWGQRQRPDRLQPDPEAPYATSKPLLPPEFQGVASARSHAGRGL